MLVVFGDDDGSSFSAAAVAAADVFGCSCLSSGLLGIVTLVIGFNVNFF